MTIEKLSRLIAEQIFYLVILRRKIQLNYRDQIVMVGRPEMEQFLVCRIIVVFVALTTT